MPDTRTVPEQRPAPGEVEQRSAPVQTAPPTLDGRRLRGVIPYGVESRDMGGFREVMARGCLANADTADLVATVDHAGVPLARFPSTLDVEDRDDGLHWSLELPESRADVREAVERGDLRATSWRMIVGRERWQGEVRHVEQVAELRDVSLVTNPAYSEARAEYRSADQNQNQNPSPSEDDNTNAAATRQENTNAATARQENVNMPDTLSPEDRNAQPDPDTETREGGSLQVEDRAQQVEQRSVEDRLGDALRDVRVGETRALTTSATISPGELSPLLFDKLRASSVGLSTGMTVLSTDKDSVIYPALTADVVPSWYAEAAPITPGDPTFASVTATPRKLAHLVQMSNEVIDDSDPSIVDVLNNHLLRVLALKLDVGLFEGSGTAPEVRGLKNVAGIQTVTNVGANGGPLANLDAIADAIGLLETVNTTATAIVMPPRTYNVVRKLKTTVGEYLVADSPTVGTPRTLFGVPIYVSGGLSVTEAQGTATNSSSVYVFNAAEVVYVRRSEVELELDRSRLFNSDQSELRAKLRGDLIVPNPAAVVRVVGVTP